MEYVVLILVAAVVILSVMNQKTKKDAAKFNGLDDQEETGKAEFNHSKIDVSPYTNKLLLTKNEWYFYKALKPIADKYNLHPIAKIRLADIVDVKHENKKEKYTYFNKIRSKHIDFALCDPENLRILLLIELDDSSHDTNKRKQRDLFVDKVLEKCRYKLLRARGTATLEQDILNAIPDYIKISSTV